MNKYYTRACNFYYGTTSKKYIKKKKSIPLNGYNNISFDKLQIISRKKNKIINLSDFNKLTNKLKNNGISINANGIRVLKLSSNVRELVIQWIPLK